MKSEFESARDSLKLASDRARSVFLLILTACTLVIGIIINLQNAGGWANPQLRQLRSAIFYVNVITEVGMKEGKDARLDFANDAELHRQLLGSPRYRSIVGSTSDFRKFHDGKVYVDYLYGDKLNVLSGHQRAELMLALRTRVSQVEGRRVEMSTFSFPFVPSEFDIADKSVVIGLVFLVLSCVYCSAAQRELSSLLWIRRVITEETNAATQLQMYREVASFQVFAFPKEPEDEAELPVSDKLQVVQLLQRGKADAKKIMFIMKLVPISILLWMIRVDVGNLSYEQLISPERPLKIILSGSILAILVGYITVRHMVFMRATNSLWEEMSHLVVQKRR